MLREGICRGHVKSGPRMLGPQERKLKADTSVALTCLESCRVEEEQTCSVQKAKRSGAQLHHAAEPANSQGWEQGSRGGSGRTGPARTCWEAEGSWRVTSEIPTKAPKMLSEPAPPPPHERTVSLRGSQGERTGELSPGRCSTIATGGHTRALSWAEGSCGLRGLRALGVRMENLPS